MKLSAKHDVFLAKVDGTEPVNVCVVWRYLGQPCPPGTRVDLRCGECGHRVCANPNSVRFHEGGATILCRECVELTENA
jgi:hypothetical protein